MTDREKVIEHITDCVRIADCQINHNWVFVRSEILIDALALLKAEEDTRLTPRKPYHTKVEYANGSHWITDQCPECVERGELGIWDTLVDRHVKYCRRCGQALDWSEYNDRDEIDWDEYMSNMNERAKRMAERRRSVNEYSRSGING